MKISELIKKIRVEHGYSFQEMASKLGFSKGMISAVEREDSPVSKNLVESYIKNYPLYKNKLIKSYLEQFMPENIDEEINIGNISLAELYMVKIYNFISNGDGKINLSEYNEEQFPLDEKDKIEIYNNGYVFKVLGDNMKPHFLKGDIIILSNKEFKNWQSLNNRLLLVKINNDYYLRKLLFKNGKAFLFSFNENVYPEFELPNNAEYIGELTGQLERNVEEIEFK